MFHGDSQVTPNRVRVFVMAGSQGQDAVVRIRSSAVVDEPVVGVVLRSICGQKNARRYEFLTEFPVETRAAAVPTIIPASVTAQNPTLPSATDASLATQALVSAASQRSGPVRSTTNPVPVVRAPRLQPASKPIVAKEPNEAISAPKELAPKADNKPRLKLDLPETPDVRPVQLKPASDMVLTPTEDPQKREAAVAAWRELNNLPLENTQEKQRLLTLEAESKTLKALLAKNEADFKLRLDRLESNRYSENFVYGLLGLLSAAIAAAAFFWNRARQRIARAGTDWSHQGEPGTQDMDRAGSASLPASIASHLPANTFPGSNHDADVDESLFDDLKKLTAVTLPTKQIMPVTPVPRSRFTGVTATSIYPEDFLDVQQHADFFVSLGQYDQAIEVLKKSIRDSADTSPLAYLELLKIYHTLGRQLDYQQQREAFNHIFNSHIPDFSAFTQEGSTLEGYPAVLRSIEAKWGVPNVLDYIEACLFRDTAAATGKPFDLAAFRELLLLYAMAQGTIHQTDGSVREAMTKARAGRASRPLDLEQKVSKPAPLDISVPRETSFTQPMLLSEMAALDAQDTHPEPLAPIYRPPLDLDLDLNLDFSNSELMAMQELPFVPAAPPSVPASLDLDLNLDLNLELSTPLPSLSAATATITPVTSAIDSNMLDFDLFDPKVEAKISPKKN